MFWQLTQRHPVTTQYLNWLVCGLAPCLLRRSPYRGSEKVVYLSAASTSSNSSYRTPQTGCPGSTGVSRSNSKSASAERLFTLRDIQLVAHRTQLAHSQGTPTDPPPTNPSSPAAPGQPVAQQTRSCYAISAHVLETHPCLRRSLQRCWNTDSSVVTLASSMGYLLNRQARWTMQMS